MSKLKTLWNTKENASVYDKYAQTFPLYKNTSKDLVEISGLTPNMTIIDLAAGTGTTTQAILDKTEKDTPVIAIDQAEEMLKKAKEKFKENKNISYIVSQAEEVDLVISKKVDAVICNSAFWQMSPEKVFKSVSHILKMDGIFAFNLPDQFFEYNDFKKKPNKPLSYNLDDLIKWGKKVELNLTTSIVREYEKNKDEVLAFNQIPIMKKNFPNKEEEEEFIKRILSDQTPKKSQWVYFVFKKNIK